MRRFLFSLLLGMCAAFSPSSTLAGVYELPLEADVCAIKTALAGKTPDGCTPAQNLGKTRAVTGRHQAVASSTFSSENGYFIHFAFDSDRLSEAYQRHLRTLSTALRSDDMAQICVLLVGHTDAVGSWNYNQSLSERRARSVKNFLVGTLSMPSSRFAAAGHGEKDLLAGYQPSDAHHRRVEILARQPGGAACSGG